jgi:plastocyanin
MFNLSARAMLCIAVFTAASAVHAADFEVTQKNKQFSQKSLSVKVGDSVGFKNEDPFVHNIFSLSDTKTFDLGTYPQGQAKKVTFDKPGTVEIECAIHPDMKMTIEVKK